MTATTPELIDELEVEYVLWEAEDPLNRPCEAVTITCPNVALYRMLWVPSKQARDMGWKTCHCGSTRLCLGCKDWVLNQESDSELDVYSCRECKGFADLKGIEPIRARG